MKLCRNLLWLAAMLTGLAAQAGTITYYHNDIAGSPVVATDAGGNVLWRESYRPYGERLTNAPASVDNRVWFTGRRQDVETGLVYMGARHYDPLIGRFMSKDPAGFDENNLHSHNRYAYANNNPYRYGDPDGRSPQAVRALFQASFGLATLLGARELGQRLSGNLWVLLNENGEADDGAGNEPTSRIDPASGSDLDPADKGGELTKAGRAQQKHGDRAGSAFDRATGTAADKNERGQKTLDSIVNAPDRTEEPNRAGGVDVRENANGRGARFDKDGKFTGFIEPRRTRE